MLFENREAGEERSRTRDNIHSQTSTLVASPLCEGEFTLYGMHNVPLSEGLDQKPRYNRLMRVVLKAPLITCQGVIPGYGMLA